MSMSCDTSTLRITKQKRKIKLRWVNFYLVISILKSIEAGFKLADCLLRACITPRLLGRVLLSCWRLVLSDWYVMYY